MQFSDECRAGSDQGVKDQFAIKMPIEENTGKSWGILCKANGGFKRQVVTQSVKAHQSQLHFPVSLDFRPLFSFCWINPTKCIRTNCVPKTMRVQSFRQQKTDCIFCAEIIFKMSSMQGNDCFHKNFIHASLMFISRFILKIWALLRVPWKNNPVKQLGVEFRTSFK